MEFIAVKTLQNGSVQVPIPNSTTGIAKEWSLFSLGGGKGMENEIYSMCGEREDSAKRFLAGLSDSDDLISTINILDGVMDILTEYAINIGTGVDEARNNSYAISMIRYLNSTINALKYIGTHDVLRKEE